MEKKLFEELTDAEKEEFYVTGHLGLNAWLMFKGFEPEYIKRFNQEVVFYYYKYDDLRDTVDSFFNQKELRDYLTYHSKVRHLIRLTK